MTMSPIQHVVEAAVYVDDLDRAESFYGGILQLPKILREDGRHVFYKAGESVLLVFIAESTARGGTLPPHGAAGPIHVALGVARDAIDAWRERLLDHGVAIEQEVDWPLGGHSLYFRDPANNLVELITPGCWGLPSGW